MTRTEHLLTILAEELNEAAVRVSKIKRFGANEIQPGQPHDNDARLRDEMIDALAVYGMLIEEGTLETIGIWSRPKGDVHPKIAAKRNKVEEFLRHSRRCGTLDSYLVGCKDCGIERDLLSKECPKCGSTKEG